MSSEHEQQRSRSTGEQIKQPNEEPWADLELTLPHTRHPTAIVSFVECALVELTYEDMGRVRLDEHCGSKADTVHRRRRRR